MLGPAPRSMRRMLPAPCDSPRICAFSRSSPETLVRSRWAIVICSAKPRSSWHALRLKSTQCGSTALRDTPPPPKTRGRSRQRDTATATGAVTFRCTATGRPRPRGGARTGTFTGARKFRDRPWARNSELRSLSDGPCRGGEASRAVCSGSDGGFLRDSAPRRWLGRRSPAARSGAALSSPWRPSALRPTRVPIKWRVRARSAWSSALTRYG
jgi:hypothetical protein